MKKSTVLWSIFGFFVFVVVTLTVPNLLILRIMANQTSAQESVKKIYQAEMQYISMQQDGRSTCSLAVLGDASLGKYALPLDIAEGFKAGYEFSVSECGSTTTNGKAQPASFRILAVPVTKDRSGKLAFCVDGTGKVSSDPHGEGQCTDLVD